MADIRINALATTAASTASDDFLAIDGSANGTRKLNAFSPTFGGNLTVSGTGTVTGDVTITRASSGGGVGVRNVNTDSSGYASLSLNNSGGTAQSFDIGTGGSAVAITALRQKLYIYDSTAGTTVMRLSGGSTSAVEFLGTGTHSFAGNLTVSGTGTSSVAGNLGIGTTSPVSNANQTSLTINGTNYSRIDMQKGGSTYFNIVMDNSATGLSTIGSLPLNLNTNGATRLTVTGGGNVLLGTPTDSSNGRLQLADHTTSAGGIGFGTDTSLFRSATNTLKAGSGSSYLLLAPDSATGNFQVYRSGADAILRLTKESVADWDFFAGTDLVIKRNSTTALTLDASQNATFAGAVTVSGADKVLTVTSSASTPGFTMRQTGGIAANRNWGIVINNSANGDFILRRSTTTSGDPTTAVLTFDSTGNATFAGSIAIGNTVQTAVGVASTHKVTISIGGSTYYLLATNV